MNRLHYPSLLPALIASSAFLVGCSKGDADAAGKFIVKGKLVENGKPFLFDASKVPLPKGATGVPPGIEASSALQVIFISVDDKRTFQAKSNPEAGTFEVPGDDGKGILPGRYKIAVLGRMGFSPDIPDYFKGQYTEANTKIVRDIKEGDEVVIDIAKPQG